MILYGDGWNGATYSISSECGEDSTFYMFMLITMEESPQWIYCGSL